MTKKSKTQVPEEGEATQTMRGRDTLNAVSASDTQGDATRRMEIISRKLSQSLGFYNSGAYHEALQVCEEVYEADAFRTDNLLLMGAVHFQMRNFSESIFYCQQCVRVDPNFAEGYSNLGNALKELGDVKAAVQFYLKAIKLKPRYSDAYNNLAGAYMQLGQTEEAQETYQMALTLNPGLVDAHSNLGNLYKASGDLEAAKRCYLESAIRLCPEFADAHSNLGNAFKDVGRVDDAISCYKKAIDLRGDFAIAHGNLGVCYWEKGDPTGAISELKYAIQLEPNYPDAYNNLAIHCYVTSIRLLPTYAAAHSNLGNVLNEQDGHTAEALQCYQSALKAKPEYPDALANMAALLKDNGQLEEAMERYAQAIELKPDHAEALSNLIHTKVQVCDWSDYDSNFARLGQLTEMQLHRKESGAVPSVQPFHSLAYPFSLADAVALVETHFTFRPKPKSVRLRIGYVSSDFGNHPMSHLTQSIYGYHDRKQFEVFCYALTGPDGSAWRRRIEQESEHFKDISLLHAGEAAQLIHNDGIHILINVNGYTRGARNEIFALHPSPLQMQWLGFAGTMGADFIEYMIADETVVPQECRSFYSEKIINMPHSYVGNGQATGPDDPPPVPNLQVPSRAKYGLSEDAFVFACFNQLYKVDPEIFKHWCNILKRTSNSVLWLLRFPPAAEANLMSAAGQHGIKPEQIVFSDVCPRDEHLLRGFLADLCLDTPAYNGHTTAADMLWSGTPILSVDTLLDYEELAVSLANDQERLYGFRRHIEQARENAATFDTKRWVSNFEAGILSAWANYESGDPLSDVSVFDDAPTYMLDEGLM
eukprot:GSChrysophyteH1.ASY1.ANO1.849.1 assembled CDS